MEAQFYPFTFYTMNRYERMINEINAKEEIP